MSDGRTGATAVIVAVLGLLAAGMGAMVQANANRELERQKFQAQVIVNYALAPENAQEIANRLLFLESTGMIDDLDREKIRAAALDPDRLPTRGVGYEHGAAVRQLVRYVGTFRSRQGRWPQSLEELGTRVDIKDQLQLLGRENLSYRLDDDRGFVLVFRDALGEQRSYDGRVPTQGPPVGGAR